MLYIVYSLIIIYGIYLFINILSVGSLNEFGKGMLTGSILLIIIGCTLWFFTYKKLK